ncbi:hypothetical protein WIW50_04865 [Flavobacteriaceae bacterium 3-367]
MKKRKYLILLFFTSIFTYSQIEISDSDLNKLIEIGEYYSKNVMLIEKSAIEDLEKLRSEKLNNIINVLQTQSKRSLEVLDKKYLNRPNYDDLVMWYVIREIHYNLTDKDNEPRASIDVAKDFLSKEIDERWLLDNYYHRLYGAVAMIFNTTDLSEYNIELDSYGLKSNTEKAIVFLNLMDALGTRFRVLQMMKNNKKLIEFSSRMPKFNSKEYFYYTDFQYEDFEWIGHKKIEMFNERHIGLLYEIILAHMNAESDINGKKETVKIYQNSIMTKPEYFKYSSLESDLKKLYKKSK